MTDLTKRLITVDEATTYLAIEADNRLHWSLGQLAASEWSRLGNAPVRELRPKTDSNATVPAGHFKACYPFGFLIPFVLSHLEVARRQLSLFPDEDTSQ